MPGEALVGLAEEAAPSTARLGEADEGDVLCVEACCGEFEEPEPSAPAGES